VIASDPRAEPIGDEPPDRGSGERVGDYQFDLPPDRIAQAPIDDRTAARLMLLGRRGEGVGHATVAALPSLLRGDELIVLNDTRVVPARLRGRKESGGRVELLALHPIDDPDGRAGFVAIGKASKGLPPATRIVLDAGPVLVVRATREDGTLVVDLPVGLGLWELLEQAGEIPLPPYVTRPSGPDAHDRERYQTVFARHPGAVAAPTAGLHFTPALLSEVHNKGCEVARVTLHVGPGTFAPVRAERIADHRMHHERFTIDPAEARTIEAARAAGRPVLAVGTTVVRTLEAVAGAHDGHVVAGAGSTDIFIRPGYRFRVVDQLMTNFHLPGSTLIMLVSAFAGRERVLDAYGLAIASGYRFYSYGDGMLIR